MFRARRPTGHRRHPAAPGSVFHAQVGQAATDPAWATRGEKGEATPDDAAHAPWVENLEARPMTQPPSADTPAITDHTQRRRRRTPRTILSTLVIVGVVVDR